MPWPLQRRAERRRCKGSFFDQIVDGRGGQRCPKIGTPRSTGTTRAGGGIELPLCQRTIRSGQHAWKLPRATRGWPRCLSSEHTPQLAVPERAWSGGQVRVQRELAFPGAMQSPAPMLSGAALREAVPPRLPPEAAARGQEARSRVVEAPRRQSTPDPSRGGGRLFSHRHFAVPAQTPGAPARVRVSAAGSRAASRRP